MVLSAEVWPIFLMVVAMIVLMRARALAGEPLDRMGELSEYLSGHMSATLLVAFLVTSIVAWKPGLWATLHASSGVWVGLCEAALFGSQNGSRCLSGSGCLSRSRRMSGTLHLSGTHCLSGTFRLSGSHWSGSRRS